MKRFLLNPLMIIQFSQTAFTQQTVQRTDLLSMEINQHVSVVEIKRILMPANTKAPCHMHPCPVSGTIISGEALYQPEGDSAIILRSGDAFFEPKDKPILHFDNVSKNQPLVFIAFYMKEDKEPNIQILEKYQSQ